MHIQDFYAKLVSINEENPLFSALRKLTQFDPKSAFSADDLAIDNWATWVPAGPEPV
jgi:hypothetical protein